MILEADEIEARVSSPLNLLNRLRAEVKRASDIVSIPSEVQPSSSISSVPTVDNLVENLEDKLNKGKAVSGAKALMAESIDRLRTRLIEVDKPTDLAKIAVEMNKIVNGSEFSNKNQANTPIVIWKPEVHNEAHYETIVVSD